MTQLRGLSLTFTVLRFHLVNLKSWYLQCLLVIPGYYKKCFVFLFTQTLASLVVPVNLPFFKSLSYLLLEDCKVYQLKNSASHAKRVHFSRAKHYRPMIPSPLEGLTDGS